MSTLVTLSTLFSCWLILANLETIREDTHTVLSLRMYRVQVCLWGPSVEILVLNPVQPAVLVLEDVFYVHRTLITRFLLWGTRILDEEKKLVAGEQKK